MNYRPNEARKNFMSKEIIAGFQLVEQQPSRRDRVEHWRAVSVRDHRTNADIYFISDALMSRAQHLPQWGPFASFDLRRDGTNNIFIVPNCLKESIIDVSNRLGGGVGLCLTWHAVNALSRLHNQGGSHGLLHPNSIGIDQAVG